MNDEIPEIEYSPLEGPVTREGQTADLCIDHAVGEAGGWNLEIVDAYRTSTVFDERFATDREAYEAAKATIDEDGIDSVIGPKS